MSDRREPTISGLRVDMDDPRLRNRTGTQQKPATSAPKAGGRNDTGQSRPAPSVARPVIVRSKLAPIAFIFALLALGCAGFLGWKFLEAQNQLIASESRIAALEEKLVMSDDESTASLTALQASLKEAHSEIRKLWGVSYDRNRKAIEANTKGVASLKSQSGKVDERVNRLASEITLISDLVDAQQTALTGVEKSNASVSAQARAMNEKSAIIDQRIAELRKQIDTIEQDIDAINGFRRTVNQELLELKGGYRSQ